MDSLSLEGELQRKEQENEASSLSSWQRWVFSCTFCNYAFAHWTRKSYTNVKVSLMSAGVSPLTLAAMDSGFMFTYAGGSFVTGVLGDRLSPVLVVSAGLLGSTLCLLMIAYGASTSIVHSAAGCATWFLTCQLLHGLFQATGGPVNTAIMGAWFPAKGRGLVFGLWTCHQYVGDIVAALASAWILRSTWNWKWCIVIPAVLNGLWGVVNLVSVPSSPQEAGLIKEKKTSSSTTAGHSQAGDKAAPIGFFEAFMLPNVLSYAIAFGFFKLVNYAMFFQLPVILTSHFDQSTSNVISSLYSVGMMPGGIVCGWVSDLYGGRRACVIATFMGVLVPLLLVLAFNMDTLSVSALLGLLCLMGCLVGGPNNIITSAVAADLADDPSIRGNSKAIGTVTGIINGTGSVTAACGQLLIPILYGLGRDRGVGYRYVWLFLVFCTLVGTSLMTGKIRKELSMTEEVGSTAAEVAPLQSSHPQRSSGYQALSVSEDHEDAIRTEL